MSHYQLINLSSILGLVGIGILTVTALFGNLLTLQTLRLIKVKIFKYHRLMSLIGVVLVLLHPIPLVFAHATTGVSFISIFVPFMADKKVTIIAIGIFALYVLLVVLLSSLFMKHLKQKVWRSLHYGSYLFFGLGFWHSLFISTRFEPNAEVSLLDPKKIILEGEIVLLFVFIALRVFFLKKQNNLMD